jgi:phosphoglycerol transferase MdoB-like AlkP superfamily enzyme
MLENHTPFEAVMKSYQYTKEYSFTILLDILLLIIGFVVGLLMLNVLQLLYPIVLLLLLLLFQTIVYILYYRHYDLLFNESINNNTE